MLVIPDARTILGRTEQEGHIARRCEFTEVPQLIPF